MDIVTLINLLKTDGDILRIMRDPFAMFGSEMMRKTYLGARFLPERIMTGIKNNIIKEEETRFRTIIAEDSGRYDPVPLRQLAESYSMMVEMGHFDMGREIDGAEYDKILEMLASNRSDAARARMLYLIDTMLNHALKDKKEKQRWDAIVKRQVRIEKSNGQQYDVLLDFPAGNDISAPNFFDDDSADPFDTIFDAINILKDLGYGNIEAIVSRYAPLSAMMKNQQVKNRYGGLTIDNSNNLQNIRRGVVGKSMLDMTLTSEGYPAFTEYNQGYNTETDKFLPYLPLDSMTIIASTDRREEIIIPDGEDMLIPSTLGYYGVGTPQGQTEAGDVVKLFPKEDKPVRIEGQAEGVGFPIILETKAIVNIRNCVPTP